MKSGGGFEVEGLSVRAGERTLLRSVSFRIATGEILALVGESGSGKSLLCHALIGALKPSVRVVAGCVRFQQIEDSLVGKQGEAFHARVRGRGIGLLLQDAGRSLHPTRRIGDQLREMLVLAGREASKDEMVNALREVELADGERILRAYPHQLSGGQVQRVAFALLLCGQPEVLLLDEPTTALDPLRREGVLRLLTHLAESRSMSLLLVTHDLPMAARVADRVLVLHQGRTVEWGESTDVLADPLHPYTQALLRSTDSEEICLVGSTGQQPDPSDAAAEERCHYASTCPIAQPICVAQVPCWRQLRSGRWISCHAAENPWDEGVTAKGAFHGP